MAYFPERNALVLHGGWNDPTWQFRKNVWLLTIQNEIRLTALDLGTSNITMTSTGRVQTGARQILQTSTNLAIVQTARKGVSVQTSQRSSVESAKKDAGRAMSSAMELAGFSVNQGDGYPGWKPNVSSPILGVAKKVYAELFGREPEVKAIHAGLECGIIGEKFPGIDTISFGPTIRNAHSPDECVNVPSVANFWRYLTALLPRM